MNIIGNLYPCFVLGVSHNMSCIANTKCDYIVAKSQQHCWLQGPSKLN